LPGMAQLQRLPTRFIHVMNANCSSIYNDNFRMQPEITISAQFLEAGQGGICRVGRLTTMAFSKVADVHALAVEDRSPHNIGSVTVRPFSGNRWRFALANMSEIVAQRHMLYDFPGTARAHLLRVPMSKGYAVWCHGFELWDLGSLRSDYVAAVK